MKAIDWFFDKVIALEDWLEEFEDWHRKNTKVVACVFFILIIICYISFSVGQELLGQLSFLLWMVWSGVEKTIGWKHSVRKWLRLCLLYNLFFSIILAGVIQGYIKYSIFTPLFIGIYMLIWIAFSLIADSKVALLVNEIVSVITAAILAIGTYLIAMELKQLSTLEELSFAFSSEVDFLWNALNGDGIAWKYIKRMFLEWLEGTLVALLPAVVVSTLGIVVIRIKEYWMIMKL